MFHINPFYLPFWILFIVVFFLEVLEQEIFQKNLKKVNVKTVYRLLQVHLLVDYKVGTFNFKAHLAGVIKSENRLLISPK